MAITKTSGLLCIVLLLSSTLFLHGASHELLYRKMLLELKKMALKNGLPKHVTTSDMTEDSELRRVPTGPDPLHHNGRDPTKPRTP